MLSSTFWRRALARLRRNRMDDELREEIQQHLALRRQSLIDSGMDPEAADREARRGFGNVLAIRERARDTWTFPALSALAQDVRFALRMMRRNPGYAAIVVLTVGLGTGLNGAVFVLTDAALLRPPVIAQVQEVVRLDDGKPAIGPPYPDYVDYRDRVADAVDLAAYGTIRVSARTERPGGGLSESATAALASGNYFDVLRVRPLHGRTFDGRADLPPLGTPVVVLGEAYWARRFNRDPGVVGTTIELNRRPFTIVGIVPAAFKGVEIAGAGSPNVREMYVPLWCLPLLEPGDSRLAQRTVWWGLQSVGRLRPGVTMAEARARVAGVAAALDREYPGVRDERIPRVAPITQVDLRLLMGEGGIAAAAMSTATLLVLLIACANVANLGLARACARHRETAVRLSLGAGRWRVVRQFLTESLLLSSIGTGLGFALAIVTLRVATAAGDGQPSSMSFGPSLPVVIYGALVTLLVSAATGVVPALQASRPALLAALKDGRGSTGRGRLRAVFVGAEVAICLMLLVTTSLILRSAQRARAIDPVIPALHLLAVETDGTTQAGYTGPAQTALLADIEQRLQGLPGVTNTALARPVPFSGSRHGTTVRRIDAADAPGLHVFLANVSPSFFAVAGLPILRGRAFAAGAPDEVVVSQTLASRLWADTDPLGQRFTANEFSRTSHVVVGVVRDTPFISLRQRNEPFMFRPIDPSAGGAVVARTVGPAAALIRTIDTDLKRIDARLSFDVTTVADGIDQEIGTVRNGAVVAAGLGGLALLLALFGVGAVTANAVAQRTHEIGVRMALGARTGDAIALVVRQSMRPVLGGVALGLIGTALLGRALAALLYGLSSVDPIAFGTPAAFLIAASILAAWVPARRAARIDPLVALRTE